MVNVTLLRYRNENWKATQRHGQYARHGTNDRHKSQRHRIAEMAVDVIDLLSKELAAKSLTMTGCELMNVSMKTCPLVWRESAMMITNKKGSPKPIAARTVQDHIKLHAKHNEVYLSNAVGMRPNAESVKHYATSHPLCRAFFRSGGCG